jgi:hypothetical protein
MLTKLFKWMWRGPALLYACHVTLLFAVQSASGQQQLLISPVQLVHWDMAKREILLSHLQISQAEAEAFWKIYEQYERTRRSLLKSRLQLISEYAQAGTNTTQEKNTIQEKKINSVTKRLLLNDLDYKRIYKEYYKRIKVIITPCRAMQFIQMEKYFQYRLDTRMDSLAFKNDHVMARDQQNKKK